MSSRHPGLIETSQLSNRFFTGLVLCLLGLAVLSNRPIIVKQVIGLNSTRLFHLPAERSTASDAGHGFFLESADDAVVGFEYAQRNSIGIKSDLQTPVKKHWIRIPVETDAPISSPVHLFGSVMNL